MENVQSEIKDQPTRLTPEVENLVRAQVRSLITPEDTVAIIKAANPELSAPVPGRGVRRYQFDYSNQDMNMRRKPQSGVSFQMLRQFAQTHEITRMCINARKRQITQLEWDIVPADKEDKTDYTEPQALLVEFFKNLGGYKVRFRAMLDQIIEDLMALDAVALYRERNRAGQVLYYTPLDATTIKLRVDEFGNVPEPPEVAYKQIIRGQLVAELTTDDLIYDMMNPRSATPYGLAPLETLIIVVSTALKSNLYNLNYLTDGNIPEGLFTVPEAWSVREIKEYQEVWDAYLAGDPRATSRLRFVPGGTGTSYYATKKPTDMQFKELNEWLLKLTCGMFDVQPQEIGFTEHQSTRANAGEQGHIQTRRGMKPMANFLQELFTDIIQHDLGIPDLKFEFLGLEDHDALQEAQAIQARVFTGLTTIDEERKELGMDPLGIDQPFVIGQATFLPGALQMANQPDTVSSENAAGTTGSRNEDGQSEEPDDPTTQDAPTTEQASQTAPRGDDQTIANSVDALRFGNELRKLRLFAMNRVKQGKKPRPFSSEVFSPEALADLNARLIKCTTGEQVREIIDEYRADYQVDLVSAALELKQQLTKVA